MKKLTSYRKIKKFLKQTKYICYCGACGHTIEKTNMFYHLKKSLSYLTAAECKKEICNNYMQYMDFYLDNGYHSTIYYQEDNKVVHTGMCCWNLM